MFAAGTGSVQKNDDWRRTAHGWERLSAWSSATQITAISGSSAPNRPVTGRAIHLRNRADAHPAAVALMQLVGSMLALAIFSPRGRSLLREKSLSTLLAGSFRASAFGS
jgi:hypothetical protein